MSDSGTGRKWKFFLDDMRTFAEKVLTYTEGMGQEEFTASGVTYDATVRNLELIGEAATHIPENVRRAHPEYPGGWSSPQGTV